MRRDFLKKHISTLIALILIIASILLGINDTVQIFHTRGKYITSIQYLIIPFFMGPLVIILGLIGFVKNRNSLSALCVFFGILLVLWIPIMIFSMTILGGP